MLLSKVKCLWITYQTLLLILSHFSISEIVGYVLAFQFLIYGLSTQHCLLGITIYYKYCGKTKFRWKKWPQLNFQVWQSIVAFLALMAVEYQIKLKSSRLLPNEPNYIKKLWKFDFYKSLAFALAFMTFIGLFEFFWDPWSLRSPGVCSIGISKHYIIKKS